MRKRDIFAMGLAIVLDVLLIGFLINAAYLTTVALLQGPQPFLGQVFNVLSLLVAVAGILFCGVTFFWIIKHRYREAAKFQRFCLVSMVSQSVIAIGTLLQPTQGGVGGFLAVIGTLVIVFITAILTIPWLILRKIALRYGA